MQQNRYEKSALHRNVALLKAMCVTCMILAVLLALPTAGEAEVYEDVVRLHVLAHSDSPEDQAHKMAVSQAVTDAYGHLLAGCESAEEAEAALRALLPSIKGTAEDTLQKRGCDKEVSVTLGIETYDRRELGDMTFPAGDYLSLVIAIGSGEGHNTWSVLFPEVAVYVASDAPSPTLASEQLRLVRSGEGEVRFRVLEILSALQSQIRRK